MNTITEFGFVAPSAFLQMDSKEKALIEAILMHIARERKNREKG